MTMQLAVDRARPVPLARQIQSQLERLISERLLAPGVKLPATRELARELGVNRATVALAYEELVAAGWAHAHVGQGTFVAPPSARGGDDDEPVAAERAVSIDWSSLLSRSAQIVAADTDRALTGMPGRSTPGVISFAGGIPDSGMFPTEAFRRVLNHVIRDEGKELLQYYRPGGYLPLRQFLSTYLLRHGLEARPDEILVVNGSQQGFDLIARTLLDAGDLVAMEQPTYPRAMQVFRSCGAQILPVPLEADGPRLDVLERTLTRHRPKFFYCQPAAHNPTGLTMGVEARYRLLEVAARYHVPIVEDGFDGSLYYGARPPAPLKSLDRHGLVAYIGTFSKILFPGLRLGWVIAPPALLESLAAAKQIADIHTSALIQAAVHRFCERRLLERHLVRIAKEYGRRRALLLTALARRMPTGVTWTKPQGGFSLLLTLPEGLEAALLLPHALERGVSFTPGTPFFVDGSGARTLRLSFSTVPAARIDDGVRRLADSIRHVARHPVHHPDADRSLVPLV